MICMYGYIVRYGSKVMTTTILVGILSLFQILFVVAKIDLIREFKSVLFIVSSYLKVLHASGK